MATNIFPSSTLFHYPILQVLADGKEHTQKDFKAKVIEAIPFTQEDLEATLNSGVNKIQSWVGFAVRNLKDAHLIDTPKKGSGKYYITEAGKQLLGKCPNGFTGGPDTTLLKLMDKLDIKADGKAVKPSPKEEVELPKEDVVTEKSITVKLSDLAASANATLPDSLLEAVKQMNPKSFEVLIKKLLIAMGYGKTTEDVIVTQYVGDNGIDGYVRKDRLDIEKLCAYQAKRYTNTNVGITEMNALGGSMINCGTNCGIFVTTTDYTAPAMKYDPRGYTIIRINGKQLVGYLIEFGIGVKTERIEVKTVDTDFLNSL